MTTLTPSFLIGSSFNIWRNVVTTLVLSILNGSSSFLHTRRTTILKSLDEFEFWQDYIAGLGVTFP